MRMLIGVVCFASIASAISSAECMAPHFSFVSQSISGVTTTSIDPNAVAFTEKIDYETFDQVVTNYATLEDKWATTANVTLIIDMGKRRFITYRKIENEEIGVQKMCSSQVLPDSYNAAALASFYQALTDAAVCISSDGTHDIWNISKSFQPSGDSVDLEYVTTQDLLWDSVSGSTTLQGVEGPRENTSVSSAEAGGPLAADLDPAQFDVECKEVPTFEDFNVKLFSSKVPGVFRKHVLAALHTALAPQQTAIVV